MTDDVKARLAEYGLESECMGGAYRITMTFPDGDTMTFHETVAEAEVLITVLRNVTAATRAPLEARIAELEGALTEARRWIGDGDCSGDAGMASYWTDKYRNAIARVDAALQQKGQENGNEA